MSGEVGRLEGTVDRESRFRKPLERSGKAKLLRGLWLSMKMASFQPTEKRELSSWDTKSRNEKCARKGRGGRRGAWSGKTLLGRPIKPCSRLEGWKKLYKSGGIKELAFPTNLFQPWEVGNKETLRNPPPAPALAPLYDLANRLAQLGARAHATPPCGSL